MLQAGDAAPEFDLPDLAGQRHRLAGEALEPVLAVFWKPSCGTCHLAFPYLQRLVEAYDGGWQLLAVSQDALEPSAAFAREYGLTFPVLIEGEGWPASQLYDPEATPTAYLIGRDGRIEMVSVGFSKEDLNEMSRRLADHLGRPAALIAPGDDGNPPFKPG